MTTILTIEALTVPGAMTEPRGRRRVAASELREIFNIGGYDELASEGKLLKVTEGQTGGRSDVFALRVEGNSMIDALINDGDVVIMQATRSCDDGEMVAVWLRDENETTLKRFFHEGDRVRLQPMNAAMAPIYTRADNVEVQGRVIAAIRSW